MRTVAVALALALGQLVVRTQACAGSWSTNFASDPGWAEYGPNCVPPADGKGLPWNWNPSMLLFGSPGLVMRLIGRGGDCPGATNGSHLRPPTTSYGRYTQVSRGPFRLAGGPAPDAYYFILSLFDDATQASAFFEVKGDSTTVSCGLYQGNGGSYGGGDFTPNVDIFNTFNTWEIDWAPNYVDWYFNGQHVAHFSGSLATTTMSPIFILRPQDTYDGAEVHADTIAASFTCADLGGSNATRPLPPAQ